MFLLPSSRNQRDGTDVGVLVGVLDGVLDGVLVGVWVGWVDVGFLDGIAVGTDVGVLVGVLDGVLVGVWVGWVDGGWGRSDEKESVTNLLGKSPHKKCYKSVTNLLCQTKTIFARGQDNHFHEI